LNLAQPIELFNISVVLRHSRGGSIAAFTTSKAEQ